ncbi:TPA: hypothetical protein ACPJ2O_004625 [Vibrio diabolicus]
MTSHSDIQKAYVSGNMETLKSASIGSLWNSFQILKKTSFYGKIDELKHINDEFDRLSVGGKGQDYSLRIQQLGDVNETRRLLYDGIGDDLLLLAAFENYMCSTLLKHGYIIHQAKFKKSDRKLYNRQREHKVHISELSKYQYVQFKDVTMNGSRLLKPGYISVVLMSEVQLKGLENLKDRRNKSHFDNRVYCSPTLNESFFAALEFITSSIESEIAQIWPDRL